MAKLLKEQGVGRIGIEATDGCQRGVVRALRSSGLVIQPLQIKAFAIVKLPQAKTDRVDAGLIAGLAAVMDNDRPPPDRRLPAFAS